MSPSLLRRCPVTGKSYIEQEFVYWQPLRTELLRDLPAHDKGASECEHEVRLADEQLTRDPPASSRFLDKHAGAGEYDSGEDCQSGVATHRPSAGDPRSRRSAHNGGTGMIYKITHRESGKAYVGLTRQSLARRMQGHKTMALREKQRPGCTKLNAAIRKHGWQAFSKQVLYAGVPLSALSGMEIVCIAMHGTHSRHGYNLTAGGELSPFEDAEVRARAMCTKNSDAGRKRRRKAFSDAGFKEKVGRGSKQRWNELTPAEHQARAQKQVNGRHAEFVRRREAKIATLTPERGRYYWNRQKSTCIGRVRRRMKAHPERFIGMDPIADLEAWWGPSFEERRRE